MKYILLISLFLIGCSDDESFTVSQTDQVIKDTCPKYDTIDKKGL